MARLFDLDNCSLLVVDSPESVRDCEIVKLTVGDGVADLDSVAVTDCVEEISSEGEADNLELDMV